jgi:hypothetical protein
MLQKIFNTFKSSKELQGPLFHYIIVTCFPKMCARIRHRRSLFYIEVLRRIQPRGSGFVISKEPLAPSETSNNDGFTQPQPVSFAPSNEPATRNNHDLDFLKELVGHDDFPSAKFPTLHERFKKMKQQKELFLYDKETCGEFCSVVNLVLQGFREKLLVLRSYRPTSDNGSYTTKQASKAPNQVNRYGHLLHKLSRCAALRMYLRHVNPLLSDFSVTAPKRVYLFKEKCADTLDREAEAEELEAELEAGLETDNKDFEFPTEPEEEFTRKDALAWQIYLRWIKLLVSHFSAATMLTEHLSKQGFPVITVNLLETSPGSNRLIPWKTLLKNRKYFPRLTDDYSPGMGPSRSNEEIISILEAAISSKPYDHGFQLQNIRDDWEQIMNGRPTENERLEFANDFDKRFRKIEETIGICGCVAYAQDIRKNLEVWKGAESQSISISSSLILSKIDSMMELCYVFSQFAAPSHFRGTVHCEASMANFLSCSDQRKRQDWKVGYLVHVFVSAI